MLENYVTVFKTKEDFNKKMEILREIEGYLAKEVLNKPVSYRQSDSLEIHMFYRSEAFNMK